MLRAYRDRREWRKGDIKGGIEVEREEGESARVGGWEREKGQGRWKEGKEGKESMCVRV